MSQRTGGSILIVAKLLTDTVTLVSPGRRSGTEYDFAGQASNSGDSRLRSMSSLCEAAPNSLGADRSSVLVDVMQIRSSELVISNVAVALAPQEHDAGIRVKEWKQTSSPKYPLYSPLQQNYLCERRPQSRKYPRTKAFRSSAPHKKAPARKIALWLLLVQMRLLKIDVCISYSPSDQKWQTCECGK